MNWPMFMIMVSVPSFMVGISWWVVRGEDGESTIIPIFVTFLSIVLFATGIGLIT